MPVEPSFSQVYAWEPLGCTPVCLPGVHLSATATYGMKFGTLPFHAQPETMPPTADLF